MIITEGRVNDTAVRTADLVKACAAVLEWSHSYVLDLTRGMPHHQIHQV